MTKRSTTLCTCMFAAILVTTGCRSPDSQLNTVIYGPNNELYVPPQPLIRKQIFSGDPTWGKMYVETDVSGGVARFTAKRADGNETPVNIRVFFEGAEITDDSTIYMTYQENSSEYSLQTVLPMPIPESDKFFKNFLTFKSAGSIQTEKPLAVCTNFQDVCEDVIHWNQHPVQPEIKITYRAQERAPLTQFQAHTRQGFSISISSIDGIKRFTRSDVINAASPTMRVMDISDQSTAYKAGLQPLMPVWSINGTSLRLIDYESQLAMAKTLDETLSRSESISFVVSPPVGNAVEQKQFYENLGDANKVTVTFANEFFGK